MFFNNSATKEERMEEKQFTKLISELEIIRNLLILNASKAGATSQEISKVLNTSDSRVRQILTAAKKKKEKIKS
jgi:DNA-directed RNA polymerase sigma subunit (sigma70/sigma32)